MISVRWMNVVVYRPFCGFERALYVEKSKLYECKVKHSRH
jgi:hypothetical protein